MLWTNFHGISLVGNTFIKALVPDQMCLVLHGALLHLLYMQILNQIDR